MNKLQVSSIALAMALGSVSVYAASAQPTLDGVAGYDAQSRGAVAFVPGKLVGDKFSFGLDNLRQGFTFKSIGAGCTAVTDTTTKKPGFKSAMPGGATVYVFALGSVWGKMGKDIADVDLKQAKSSAKVQGGAVMFTVAKDPAKHTYVYNTVVVLPSGQRLWGHQPDGSVWHHHNVNGAPYILLSFNEQGQMVPASREIKNMLAQKQ